MTRWVGSWATSQQIPEPQNSLAPEDLRDAIRSAELFEKEFHVRLFFRQSGT